MQEYHVRKNSSGSFFLLYQSNIRAKISLISPSDNTSVTAHLDFFQQMHVKYPT